MKKLLFAVFLCLSACSMRQKTLTPRPFGFQNVKLPENCTDLSLVVDPSRGEYALSCKYLEDGAVYMFFTGPTQLEETK